MNWISSIQKAIDYIENHLTEKLDYTKIAEQAICSPYYFQKIFVILCGMTVGEYIRNRKLTLAGNELITTDIKIIDLALKYGYEFPESFTRAFTNFHGVTPSEARKKNSQLKSFSRLKVQIILKGGNSMDYKISSKKSFTVLEKIEQHMVVGEKNINTIPAFWEKSRHDGTIATLLKHAIDNSFIFGICYGSGHTDCEQFDYSIAVACAPDTIAPDGYRINTIPARTWVILECTGAMPDAIQQLWHELCTEFFPTSNYQPTYELDIEAYPAGNMTDPNYKSQIWIPIKNN
ncbi:MAG: AraC family transcriptional regulator [Oscillospiraceae bacterium]|nr:AraC family transcriptional regulator [Oscillospiraceae bacterium]